LPVALIARFADGARPASSLVGFRRLSHSIKRPSNVMSALVPASDSSRTDDRRPAL
jgi:hypothetical protein